MKEKIDKTLPSDIQKMVGTKIDMLGNIFNRTTKMPKTTFDCLGARWGTSTIIDLKTFEDKHPTFELLLKNKSMKRAQWCLPMSYRKINL